MSPTVQVDADADLPGPVQGLQIGTKSRSSCSCSWNGAYSGGAEISGWIVQTAAGQESDPCWEPPIQIPGDQKHFTREQMTPGSGATLTLTLTLRMTSSSGASFRVAAVNCIGQGIWSETVSGLSAAAAPKQPHTILLEDVTDSSFEVSGTKHPLVRLK